MSWINSTFGLKVVKSSQFPRQLCELPRKFRQLVVGGRNVNFVLRPLKLRFQNGFSKELFSQLADHFAIFYKMPREGVQKLLHSEELNVNYILNRNGRYQSEYQFWRSLLALIILQLSYSIGRLYFFSTNAQCNFSERQHGTT